MRREEEGNGKKVSRSFMTGAIAFVFLIIGYQAALFIHRATVLHILDRRDCPDTVYVIGKDLAERILSAAKVGESGYSRPKELADGRITVIKSHPKPAPVENIRKSASSRKAESFRFDPNTVSVDDLCRLGFSPKQAESIDKYRSKGGRFRRKSDFARSFVVSDSVFRRLEPFIDIPLLDLNSADSAAFDALPGIGGYFASKMAEFREALGGCYSYKEQLLDIYGFSREKYEGLSDLITVSDSLAKPYRLWALPEDSLRLHPYIGSYSAHGIVLFRENNPRSSWTVEELGKAGVLRPENVSKLGRCLIEAP